MPGPYSVVTKKPQLSFRWILSRIRSAAQKLKGGHFSVLLFHVSLSKFLRMHIDSFAYQEKKQKTNMRKSWRGMKVGTVSRERATSDLEP